LSQIYFLLLRVDSQLADGLLSAGMKKSTAVKKAKSAYKLAQLLGITRQAVSKWGDGDVPPAQVAKLQELRPEWFRRQSPRP
jgi:predicted transcriptional regulator